MKHHCAESCPFCTLGEHKIVAKKKSVFAILDSTPVSRGHLLILPFRHCKTAFEMTREELCDAWTLVQELQQSILNGDKSVTGFNIGVNCGETAGQTIDHAHIHLIPRRLNDTPSPRGGVRGVIPDRMGY